MRFDFAMDLTPLLAPSLLTNNLPGVGGQIKVQPEDFEVEEIPAYEPSGSGDFLYLWLEKRDLGAEFFTRQIAQRLGIHTGDVGSAGLKDRRAITRQWVSVPVQVEERLAQLEGNGIGVLRVSRHSNKLRAGHLHGNRFRILIRALDPAVDVNAVLPVLLTLLQEHGLPNYYGSQRFGRNAETLLLGFNMLGVKGDFATPDGSSPGPAPRARSPFLKKLALSAAQSALFNHYLGARLGDGLSRRVLHGDVMAKVPFGGMFVAEDVSREQERFDAREIVSAGPIFGKKTFAAAHDAAAREAATLEVFGLSPASFSGFGKLVQGTRRHNLVYLPDLVATLETDGLRLSFTLPAGSYATVLLREIMKTQVSEESERN